MRQLITTTIALTIAILSTGCSMMAPKYSPSMDNVQALKSASNTPVKIGQFTSSNDPANANPIKLRGSALASPYENSYSAYLVDAIKQELILAKRNAPESNIEISGTLLKNDIDVSGFSTGYAMIDARFIVKRDGREVYNQIKSVKHEFPSSFAGAIAIPRGVQEYSIAVQKLLASLFSDTAFIAASK